METATETQEQLTTRLEAMDWGTLRKTAVQLGICGQQKKAAIIAAIVEAETAGVDEDARNDRSAVLDTVAGMMAAETLLEVADEPEPQPAEPKLPRLRINDDPKNALALAGALGGLEGVTDTVRRANNGPMKCEALRHALSHLGVAAEWLRKCTRE